MAWGAFHVIRHVSGHRHGSSQRSPGHAQGGPDERGPHNGAMVNLGHGYVEIAIMTTTMTPRFQVFFHDQRKQPRALPRNATVRVDTVRPSDTHEAFHFLARDGYLESTTDVSPPHVFKAGLRVSHGSHTHTHEVSFPI